MFDDKQCMFHQNPTISGTVIVHAPRNGGLYYLANVRGKTQVVESSKQGKNDLMI